MTAGAIAAFSVAATAIIASLVTGVIAIIRVLAETRAVKTEVINNAAAGAKVGQARDKKLDRIEILVDGRYGEVLQELADMKDLIAKLTGKPSDVAKAEAAQTKADEQVARVLASGPVAFHPNPEGTQP